MNIETSTYTIFRLETSIVRKSLPKNMPTFLKRKWHQWINISCSSFVNLDMIHINRHHHLTLTKGYHFSHLGINDNKLLKSHTLLIFPSFKWYRIPDQLIDWEKCDRIADMGYKKLSTSIAIKTCSIANQPIILVAAIQHIHFNNLMSSSKSLY